ncbi:MAG: hypothetical protein FIB03_14275 [Anaerolineae bacterium]|nr:hypothetical protein [Anaerolineae bacterium]
MNGRTFVILFATLLLTPGCGTRGALIIIEDTTLTRNHFGNIVIGTDNITLDCDGHYIFGSGSGAGITLVGRSEVMVENCDIINFTDGFFLQDSDNNVFRQNLVEHNADEGFDIQSSNDNIFNQNRVTENIRDGFDLEYSNGNLFIENEVLQNGRNGIELDYCNENVFETNIASDNQQNGISLDYSERNVFETNMANNNARGFQIESSNNTFSENHACKNSIVDARQRGSASNTFIANVFCVMENIP